MYVCMQAIIMLVDILSLEQGVFANTTLNVLRSKAFQQPDAATGDFLLFLHMLVHTARLECLLVGLLNVHVYLCGHIHTRTNTRTHAHTRLRAEGLLVSLPDLYV